MAESRTARLRYLRAMGVEMGMKKLSMEYAVHMRRMARLEKRKGDNNGHNRLPRTSR